VEDKLEPVGVEEEERDIEGQAKRVREMDMEGGKQSLYPGILDGTMRLIPGMLDPEVLHPNLKMQNRNPSFDAQVELNNQSITTWYVMKVGMKKSSMIILAIP